MSKSTFANRQYTGQSLILYNNYLVGNPNSEGQTWNIVVVGGNNITIQNNNTGEYVRPFSEAQGSKLKGNTASYTWQQLSVVSGWYQIATTDGKYVWRLTGSKDYASVELQATPYSGEDSQWGYNPAA